MNAATESEAYPTKEEEPSHGTEEDQNGYNQTQEFNCMGTDLTSGVGDSEFDEAETRERVHSLIGNNNSSGLADFGRNGPHDMANFENDYVKEVVETIRSTVHETFNNENEDSASNKDCSPIVNESMSPEISQLRLQ